MRSSSDGQFVTCGLSDGRVKGWVLGRETLSRRGDIGRTATAAAARPHKSGVRHICVSGPRQGVAGRARPCGEGYVVAAGGDDGVISLQCFSKARAGPPGGLCRRQGLDVVPAGMLRGHGMSVTCLALSADYHSHLFAASGGADGRCKLWDCQAGTSVFNARADRAGKVAALELLEPWAACEEGNEGGVRWMPLVVAGMAGGLVNLYDVRASPGFDGGCVLASFSSSSSPPSSM